MSCIAELSPREVGLSTHTHTLTHTHTHAHTDAGVSQDILEKMGITHVKVCIDNPSPKTTNFICVACAMYCRVFYCMGLQALGRPL